MKKSLSELCVGDLIELQNDMIDNDSTFQMSLEDLCKHFLNDYLEVNVFQSKFPVVRKAYVDAAGKDGVPRSQSNFYAYIARLYFHLEKEPRQQLLKSYLGVSGDLRSIDEQLSYIAGEKKRLNQEKTLHKYLECSDRYYLKQLEHYESKNQQAKSEILEFLSKEIRAFSFHKAQRQLLPSLRLWEGPLPYRYSSGMWRFTGMDSYHVQSLTEISNKFLDFTIPENLDILEMYASDKNGFYGFAGRYLSGDMEGHDGAVERIRKSVEDNHLLNKRREIIATLLKHYETEDYISFVNMVPLQIEGVFHDICLSVGVEVSRLSISSINEKLRLLKDELSGNLCFEYYSFKFPVIRNSVAHGLLFDGNVQHASIMLMLDLLHVCELTRDENIPLNKSLKLLGFIKKGGLEYLIEWVEYVDVNIPDFYELSSYRGKALSLYEQDEFWNYIQKEIEDHSYREDDLKSFVKKLCSKSIARTRCQQFLKDLAERKRERRNVVSQFKIALESKKTEHGSVDES
jgi:hypothetical protein